jgi:uncharacterized membrane protein (DUF485 family)
MRQPAPTVALERLLHRQQVLAWSLSGATLLTTLVFFALMGLNVPFLAQRLPGHSLTVANALAAGLILLFLAAIVLFGRRANEIDALTLHRERHE